jgi:hypothetical protein
VLALRGRAVIVARIRGAVWAPFATRRTLEHCVGFFTPVLYCGWTDRFVTPDHRCDLTPISAPVTPAPAEFRLYPSDRSALAPFIDGRGRESRLYWGRTKYVGPKSGRFWDGFGYQHIAAKHGWGAADELSTRAAIRAAPIKTQRSGPKSVRRTYEGARSRQNGATCARVVVINYPPKSSRAGNIITSYGAVVGEPWPNLPSQS